MKAAGVEKQQTFSPNGTLLLIISLLVIHCCHSFFAIGSYRDLDFVPEMPFRMYGLTFLTSMFIHASWLHVLAISLMIYIFGIHVEHRLGGLRMFVVLVISGICGDFAEVAFGLIHSHSHVHSLGASSGVYGFLAFYALLFPRDRFRAMIKRTLIPMPEHGLLTKMGLLRAQARKRMSVIQLLYVSVIFESLGLGIRLADLPTTDSAAYFVRVFGGGIGYEAHIGGVLGGIGCYWILRSRRFSRKRQKCLTTSPTVQ